MAIVFDHIRSIVTLVTLRCTACGYHTFEERS